MIEPIHDHVLVKREEPESVTRGGLIIPDVAKKRPQRGRVIRLGDGITKTRGMKSFPQGKVVPFQVAVNDLVFFNTLGGREVTGDNEDFLLIREEEILAVIPGGGQ